MAELSELNLGKEMSGSYSCQHCSGTTTKAYWDVPKGKLSWYCPECKEKSEIKFSL